MEGRKVLNKTVLKMNGTILLDNYLKKRSHHQLNTVIRWIVFFQTHFCIEWKFFSPVTPEEKRFNYIKLEKKLKEFITFIMSTVEMLNHPLELVYLKNSVTIRWTYLTE